MQTSALDSDAVVQLRFADFNALLTYKLLSQLKMVEADTVVEAGQQNVTCFLWPSDKMYQQVSAANEPSY